MTLCPVEHRVELTKQKNYSQSFNLASITIKGMDLEDRARRAGAGYQQAGSEEKITLNFFSEAYHISFPQIEFYSPSRRPFPWSRVSSFCITRSGRMEVP
jgi:hypothetical protein